MDQVIFQVAILAYCVYEQANCFTVPVQKFHSLVSGQLYKWQHEIVNKILEILPSHLILTEKNTTGRITTNYNAFILKEIHKCISYLLKSKSTTTDVYYVDVV